MIKKNINKILRILGYELKEKKDTLDCFSIQKNLVQNNNLIIFDIGANIGNISKMYRNLFPKATIYAF